MKREGKKERCGIKNRIIIGDLSKFGKNERNENMEEAHSILAKNPSQEVTRDKSLTKEK